MNIQLLPLLKNFYPNERTLDGKLVNYADYDFDTLKELDRLRDEIGSRCELIRGSHGLGKESAIDAWFPDAPFSRVVMALMQSGFSKGMYQGGSIHLDSKMRAGGLSRLWLAFKERERPLLTSKGFDSLYDYSSDGWAYYTGYSEHSFDLLSILVQMNT